MAEFVKNVPVYQGDPKDALQVMSDPPWPAGASRLQLIVVDDAGNQSDPVFVDINVKQRPPPTAVLHVVGRRGATINPPRLPAGMSFRLSGADSSSPVQAQIVEYRFTLVEAP
jgi:hypothetical protein